MKTKPIYLGLAALSIILLTLPSCKKDDSDNSGMALKVQAINNTFSVPTGEGNPVSPIPVPPAVQWDMAQIYVTTIDIEAVPESAGGGAVVRTPVNTVWFGPKLVDLFNLSQSLGKVVLPPGNYQEVEFTVNAKSPDGAGQASFYLSGTYRNVLGKSFPIVVDVTDPLQIMNEKHNVLIGGGQGNSSLSGLIRIYLDRTFSKILPRDLDEANMVDGTILISSRYNTGLYNMILANLQMKTDEDTSEGRASGE